VTDEPCTGVVINRKGEIAEANGIAKIPETPKEYEALRTVDEVRS
jgi:hypothetical protein